MTYYYTDMLHVCVWWSMICIWSYRDPQASMASPELRMACSRTRTARWTRPHHPTSSSCRGASAHARCSTRPWA